MGAALTVAGCVDGFPGARFWREEKEAALQQHPELPFGCRKEKATRPSGDRPGGWAAPASPHTSFGRQQAGAGLIVAAAQRSPHTLTPSGRLRR